MGRTRIKLIEEEAKEEKETEKTKKTTKKKSKKIFVDFGIFHIYSHFNNTLINFTDKNGNVLCWSSTGAAGFKNTKKATPYAGAKAAELLLEKIEKGFDVKEAKVVVKGIGAGREAALRVLFNSNINIVAIEDKTPIPFGGPTPPKPKKM